MTQDEYQRLRVELLQLAESIMTASLGGISPQTYSIDTNSCTK
jgi:hypothetical protein